LLRQDDYIKGQLVLKGWQHGHIYGGHLGACMILSCIANRQKLGWGTWLELLDSIDKYSALIVQPTGTPSIWDPNFVRLLHEVESCYDGSKDFANGALYWFDSAQEVTNPWFREKILDNPDSHPRVGNMNSLMLLR
jgi:hypothetical protein